jgi:hypothetical protein
MNPVLTLRPGKSKSQARLQCNLESQPRTHSGAIDVNAVSILVVRMVNDAKPQPPQMFKPADFLAWVQKQKAAVSGGGGDDIGVRPPSLTHHLRVSFRVAWRAVLRHIANRKQSRTFDLGWRHILTWRRSWLVTRSSKTWLGK